MNERNLVICASELPYANCFAENVKARKELAVKVHVCTSMENVLRLGKQKGIHMLLIDESYPYEERCQVKTEHKFVLTQGTVKDLGEGERALNKYQSSDEMLREILECYGDVIRTARRKRPQLVGVYSPACGGEKTIFAIAYGQECAKSKSTLYINMEEYAGFSDELEEGMNLGDLLYYIKQNDGSFGIRLQSAIKQMKGFSVLLPVPIVLDFKGIQFSEWQQLLEKIVENSTYETIILDIGESVQELFSFLELCDRVYMPMRNDLISIRKMKVYEKNMECLQLERLPHITRKFFLPEDIEDYARIRAREEF